MTFQMWVMTNLYLMNHHNFLLAVVMLTAWNCTAQNTDATPMAEENPYPAARTPEEWRTQLSPERYYILFEKGTERPGTGEYYMHFEKGMYTCAACGSELFSSDMKFESHCGWPSFDREVDGGKVVRKLDRSHGMLRTEILCANCGGHLGHVFNDGPTETGERYCVNSLSLDFEPETKESDQ